VSGADPGEENADIRQQDIHLIAVNPLRLSECAELVDPVQ